jgi:hypothetical protein
MLIVGENINTKIMIEKPYSKLERMSVGLEANVEET